MIIRADASTRIGMGHFTRCLALAQAWTELGGRTIFAMSETTAAADTHRQSVGAGSVQLSALRGSVPEALETAALASREQAEWIVADSYEFAPGYQRALRSGGSRVLLVDDDGRYHHYEADLVLNQNVYATESLYADRATHTRSLLGPRYALLRGQFCQSPPPARTIPPHARNVLVTLGGADAANVTQTVVEALQSIPEDNLEVTVVIGGSNPHRASLERAMGASRCKIRLVQDAKNMPELMAWADVAISAAGSTTLELAYMGVPMLLLVLADNQRAVAEGMQNLGAAHNLGVVEPARNTIADAIGRLISDRHERERLSRVAAALVDGRGATRVARVLAGTSIHLRPATADDARLLFDWANEPEVRAASFNSEPIPWTDHECWFQSRLADPNAVLLIAQNDADQPVGVARFQIAGPTATISIAVSARSRGRGYGRQLIELASKLILERPEITTIHALVKPENTASARAFLAAGYREETSAQEEARTFTLSSR
jgi:UDP-2,4-diacetamido-2,4,6-trideoxy-beta-L-altropyranose hydrolase